MPQLVQQLRCAVQDTAAERQELRFRPLFAQARRVPPNRMLAGRRCLRWRAPLRPLEMTELLSVL